MIATMTEPPATERAEMMQRLRRSMIAAAREQARLANAAGRALGLQDEVLVILRAAPADTTTGSDGPLDNGGE